MVQRFPRSAKIALLCVSLAGWLATGFSIPIAYAGWETRFGKAERETLRLAPSAFPGFPEAVARELSDRGCLIPQWWFRETPHNVVSGAFRRPDQTDWAVLCSVERRSVILIFWNGSAETVEELPRSASVDRNWLQGIGGDRIGFSRLIYAVGKSYILEHYDRYGGPEPPPIDHEGIGDAFAEKASTVNCWREGRWLELPGAD